MRVYLLIALIAATVTFLATPAVRAVAIRAGAVAEIRSRDVHKTPIPRLGGLAMYLGFAAAMITAANIPFIAANTDAAQLWGMLGGAGLVVLLGLLDDLAELHWAAKLAGQIGAATFVAWQGVQLISVPIFGLTVGSSAFSAGATILTIIIAINAVNFIDGLDGLAAGVMAISALAFFVYSYELSRLAEASSYASLASAATAALVGICLGFLPHNFHPAKIFMGDSGAMLLGMVLACAVILVTGQVDPAVLSRTQLLPATLALVLPLAVLLLPLIDMSMAVIRRVGKGNSPFHPDSKHLHHRLLAAGHSHPRAVLIMYWWAAVISFGAVALVWFPWPFVLGVWVLACAAGIMLTINFLPGLSERRRQKQAAAAELAAENNTTPSSEDTL